MSTGDESPQRPVWLTDDFLRECIKGDETAPPDLPIKNVQLKYVVPIGENFASIMVRVIINGADNGTPNNERRYIVKMTHSDEGFKKQIDELGAFPKEIDMYTNLIPKLHQMLKSAGISSRFACRCVYVDAATDSIVLEDLSPLGYTAGDRINGLDLEHTKLVLIKLAYIHGSSMKYYETISSESVHPLYFKGMISREGTSENSIVGPVFINQKIKELSEKLSTIPGYQKEGIYLSKLGQKAYDLVLDAYECKKGSIFNAQTHGDCWTNNMLFKKDKLGNVMDAILVDYQITDYNSVVNDFLYFYSISPKLDSNLNHFKILALFYLDSLKSVLAKLGYKGTIPTFEQFREEAKKKMNFAFFVMAFPLVIMKNQMKEEEKNRSEFDAVSLDKLKDITVSDGKSDSYMNRVISVIDDLRREGLISHV